MCFMNYSNTFAVLPETNFLDFDVREEQHKTKGKKLTIILIGIYKVKII